MDESMLSAIISLLSCCIAIHSNASHSVNNGSLSLAEAHLLDDAAGRLALFAYASKGQHIRYDLITGFSNFLSL
jgi:hypothetical protein